MEACCSFKTIVGSSCGFDVKDRKRRTQIVPLLSCTKDVSKHLSTLSFSGPKNEIDLILSRVALYDQSEESIKSMTICPYHRATLGIGWTRGGGTRCRVPQAISEHGKSKGTWPKGDRGLGMQESSIILRNTGVFVPPGSGICKKCRYSIKVIESKDSSKSDVKAMGEQIQELTLDDDDEVTFKAIAQSPAFQSPLTSSLTSATISETPSAYTPSEHSLLTETEDEDRKEVTSRELLNSFLAARDISPIRYQLTTPWDEASQRTKRRHSRKAKQVVFAALEEIAPESPEMLFSSLQKFGEDDENVDKSLMEALVECFNNASHWSTRRQVLSIMADKMPFSVLKDWIPGLSRYRFSVARQHALLHGRGTPVAITKSTRMYVPGEKLDHFLTFITSGQVIQDLPFGEKTLKLSSNAKITVPNVVRTLIPEQVVQQYTTYCQETGFKPMSRSSLCRVLKVCSASVRKSLQGLDYFSADGAKAFDDIEEIVEKLGDEYGKGHTWAKNQISKLKMAKRYLKSDYKVHVSTSSRVPDHCRPYALSHESDSDFITECDHQHDLRCDRCELFPSVFDEVNSALKDLAIDSEEKKDMMYVLSQSKKNIQAWKAHLLRAINQDEARLNLLHNLDPTSVLVVLDWAMKFLPRKYRESQSDWFGKRGISWHIAVAMTKRESQLQMLSFVHVFQSCTQDSYAVLAIIDDVVRQLKADSPEIKQVFLRQDNAGCYHSAFNLLAMKEVAKKHKVTMRVDFSDPQGGKGSCDRKAATIKNHIKVYLNSGKDVETADQMKTAIESSSGVHGVRVMLCDPPSIPKSEPLKWDGVSFVNNISYRKDGMKVWREYGIGKGKILKWTEFSLPKKIPLPKINIIKDATSPKATFTEVTARKRPAAKPKSSESQPTSDADSSSSDDEEIQTAKLFPCSDDGCVKSFQRFSSLQRHLDVGKHKYVLERETLLDKAMLSYAAKLDQGDASLENQPLEEPPNTSRNLEYSEVLPRGWALKSSVVQRKRLNDGQKDYLTKMFDLGEQTGHKVDANNVSLSMRKARNLDGSFMFDEDEYLTPKQIASFFSRLAKKRRAAKVDEPEDEDEEEEKARLDEECIKELSENIINELELVHPIMFESHNLCELATSSKLSKFSVQMLQEICTVFELDTSSVKAKRKQPYVDLLMELIGNCSCKR